MQFVAPRVRTDTAQRPRSPDLSNVPAVGRLAESLGLERPFYPSGEGPEQSGALLDDLLIPSVEPTDARAGGADRPAPADRIYNRPEYTVSNFVSEDRTWDINSTNTVEIARVLATLISDLSERGQVRFTKA